jgi:hypothetical protein
MATNLLRFASRQWVWIASIWLAFGLVDATQTVASMQAEGMHHPWVTLFAVTVVSWLPWALATPLVLQLARRFPPLRLRPFRTWLVHIGACVTVGLTFAGWKTCLDFLLNPYADSPPPAGFLEHWYGGFLSGLLSSFVLYAGILIVRYALDSRDRLAFSQTETARLNEQLSQAQLDALRRQIEPHFLFNALNAIAGLIREGRADAAVSMLAGLSDFLRRTLEGSTRQEVPLREEMEFVQKYLDIQKTRFADRLRLSVDVPADLYPASVPNLILQPLVENAVKHGIAKRAGGGAIRIAATRHDGMLALRVSNDGPSLPADWERAGAGIGISNVRTRLESLYGDAFELRMYDLDAGGVEVLLSLPLRGCEAPA